MKGKLRLQGISSEFGLPERGERVVVEFIKGFGIRIFSDYDGSREGS